MAAEFASRALALRMQLNVKTAELYLRKAIELEPENAQWHLEMARFQRAHGTEAARHAYATACALGSPCAIFESAALYADPAQIERAPPNSIWTADRLDIGAKVLYTRAYLDPLMPDRDIDRAVYRRHIAERTAGREPEALSKTTLEDYERCFIALIESIRAEGFHDASAIPIDEEGRILNGAHRLAVAIALELDTVPVIRIPKPWRGTEWGCRWFLQHGFNPPEINRLLRAWVQAHRDSACLLLVQYRDGVDDLMAALVRKFKLLAWRALPPVSEPERSMGEGPSMPGCLLRYVWLDASETELQQFVATQNEQSRGRLHVRLFAGQAAMAWAQILFDEEAIASWELGASSAGADEPPLALWTRYMAVPASATHPRTSGFVKWRNLRELGPVHSVIDVGVAHGTPDLYRNLSPEHVVFIEPVTVFEPKIQALQARFNSSQYLAIGLSSKDEEGVINYREDVPVLTSLLKSSPLRDTGTEKIVQMPVTLRRLDSIFPTLHGMGAPILMKIDTEGYELEALRGGVESLKKIKYLVLEVSVVKRFEGSYTCRELFEFLQLQGFLLHTCLSASVDGQGVCRVIDAVFVNTALV